MDSNASKEWKFRNGDDGMTRVSGRWGAMYFDYKNYEVGSYGCVMCGFESVVEDKTHQHISEEHGVQEKLKHLAEELGFDCDSRIDRFRKVMQTMDKVDWVNRLTEARKESPVVEEESEFAEPGLDAA